MCMISCIDRESEECTLKIIDVGQESKIPVIHEDHHPVQMPKGQQALCFQWDPTDKYVLICGKDCGLVLYDLKKKQLFTVNEKGHDSKEVKWVAWLSEGKRALTSSADSFETILWELPDKLYTESDKGLKPNAWTIIFKITEKIFPLFTYDRNLYAVIHDKKIKKWSKDLILEFTDDYDDNENVGPGYFIREKTHEKAITIKGPLNLLFPMMLKYSFYGDFLMNDLT